MSCKKRRLINRENGSYGGRPKTENNRTKPTLTDTKPTLTDTKQNAEMNRIEMKGTELNNISDSIESGDLPKVKIEIRFMSVHETFHITPRDVE